VKPLSEEHRRKISLSLLGKPKSAAHREAIKGRVFSEEWRAKISAKARLRRASPETKLKMSTARKGKRAGSANPMFGKVPSEETRKKLSLVATGRKESPKHKQWLQNYNRTRKLSPESKQKMREAIKRAWASGDLRERSSQRMKSKWANDDGRWRLRISQSTSAALRGRVQNGSRGTICTYRGVRMRSKQELKAAKSFEKSGFLWEYEPLVVTDSRGSMIPDFIVSSGSQRWICEVGDSGRKIGKLVRLAIATGLSVCGISTPRRSNQHPAFRPEAGL